MNGKPGAPVANQNALAHGYYAVRDTLNLRSFNELDPSLRVVRDVLKLRDSLITELGSDEQVTTQQRIIIDSIARDVALRDTIDAFVFSLASPLRGRGKTKSVVPIIRERDAIVKRISAGLSLIGLERKARGVSLPDWKPTRAIDNNGNDNGSDT